MKRAVVIAGLALASVAALAGHFVSGRADARAARWQEIRWPFPMDQWGEGRAFRCDPSQCGIDIVIYVRPKIGFCNCTDGVSDDAELDRLSDFDFMQGHALPRGEGHGLQVASLKGRARAFGKQNGDARVLSVALNSRCDALVATAVVSGAAAEAEAAVVNFLGDATIQTWVRRTLGS